jgi:predicted DNA-binding protein (MmcQ/YjbR family)
VLHNTIKAQKFDESIRRFRSLCLELPETTEVSSWGHPNFRAGKKTFAAVEWFKGRPSFAYRLGPKTADELRRGSQFFLTPYGRGQWLSMWIDRGVNWRVVKALLARSYRIVALKRMLVALDGSKETAG